MRRKRLWLVALLLVVAVAGGLVYRATRGRDSAANGGRGASTAARGVDAAAGQEGEGRAQRDRVRLAIAVAADAGRSDVDRVTALDGLRRQRLSPQQCERVRQIMGDTAAHASVRNNAAEVLIAQERLPQGVMADLVADWEDREQDAVWRDFALQFMAKAYAAADRREQRQAREALLDAARNERSASAGTAMLGLERLGDVDPDLRRQAQGIAAAVYADGSVPARQITAVSVAARAGHEDLLPFARQTAADTAAQARLRTACIAAVGRLGGLGDVALLEGLAQDADDRVRQAATYQLQQLRQRVSGRQGPPRGI